MLREITQAVGRFRVGNQHDFPRDVWNKIERDAGIALDKFSKSIDENSVKQSSLKGRVQVHRRLGATQ